jgi:hypothetical protein
MNRDEAMVNMIKCSCYKPFRIWGMAGKDGDWFVFSGVTMAKANNLTRKGYEVMTMSKGD